MPESGFSNPGSGSGPPKYPGTFMLAFREAAAGLNIHVKRWLGSAVECLDEQGRNLVIGLENLFRLARREPREEWPTLIADFIRTASAGGEPETLPTDLLEVADQILVRLGQPLDSLPDDAKVWSQPLDATGLCLNLVIDRDKSFCYVIEQQVSDSGKAAGEWLEQAMTNLRARTPAGCFEVIDEESGIRLCAVGDAYDSSRALLLDTLLPETCAEGYFVAVPARDCVLALPVNSQSLSFVHLIKLLAVKNHRTSPYSISDEVFWVQGGVWRSFGIDIKGQQATIQPPAEFLEVLRRLSPGDGFTLPGEASDN